ncbi:unnamed protein product [Acanthoscelides obtectus]|uniref:Uncharacterized protein n=1 Tax=Acanthoscelides obtectus TaxID=200917 RepID=A0A9P0LIA7_ACAOB|nr:unnamed protein product [Acanthoscelides obtectus]CAK1634504.1 hypothetical protein AOBTE_LOCUS8779 [Acanthoscelides obtectus]
MEVIKLQCDTILKDRYYHYNICILTCLSIVAAPDVTTILFAADPCDIELAAAATAETAEDDDADVVADEDDVITLLDDEAADTVEAVMSVVKDLGVYLDFKLTFTDHYQYIIDKANSIVRLILRTSRHLSDLNCMDKLFSSLVRSLFEYGSTIWNPYYEMYKKRIDAKPYKTSFYGIYNIE